MTTTRKANRKPVARRVRRVLIVDDHPMLRRGLAELISHEDDLGICGEAADDAEALREIERDPPDLAIIDISLRDGNGLELIKQIKARFPSVRMLVCSMHDEKLYAERALRAGALGYVNKEEATEKVVDAIRKVLAGDVYLSQHMAGQMLHRLADGGEPRAVSPIEALTDRELEVFELLGRGVSTREIAERLHLSVKTIDAHRQKIKRKLDVANSNELVQHAVKWVLESK